MVMGSSLGHQSFLIEPYRLYLEFAFVFQTVMFWKKLNICVLWKALP